MVIPGRTCDWFRAAGWGVACLLAAVWPSQAEDFRLESAGVRGGFSANQSSQDYYEIQGFVNWNLPWGLDLGKEWRLQSRLDLSAGWLGESSDNAAIGTLGPSLVLGRKRLPVSLEGGVSPTLISQHDFTSKDLGGYFQFTSHVGVNWDFAPHWRVGYRFEHISNAGIYKENPGLNMHVFSLSYRF
jgi:hypothetical protein